MIKKNKTETGITMDELARITQEGFLSIEERLDLLENDTKEVKKDIKAVKSDTEDIKVDLNKRVD